MTTLTILMRFTVFQRSGKGSDSPSEKAYLEMKAQTEKVIRHARQIEE